MDTAFSKSQGTLVRSCRSSPYAPVMRLLHILLVLVLRLDPAQTTESSGSSQGPDVEGSWQASLSGCVCVTNCVAEQSGCCDSVTPAGSAQCRKSISRTSYSVCVFSGTSAPRIMGLSGGEDFRMRDGDAGCP